MELEILSTFSHITRIHPIQRSENRIFLSGVVTRLQLCMLLKIIIKEIAFSDATLSVNHTEQPENFTWSQRDSNLRPLEC